MYVEHSEGVWEFYLVALMDIPPLAFKALVPLRPVDTLVLRAMVATIVRLALDMSIAQYRSIER